MQYSVRGSPLLIARAPGAVRAPVWLWGAFYVPVRLGRSRRRLMLGAGGFLGTDKRSRDPRLETDTVLLVRIRNTHSATQS